MRLRRGSSRTIPIGEDRPESTLWEEFLHSPMILLARLAHEASSPQPPALLDTDDPQTEASSERARIVCISDTHNHQAHLPPLPPGDVLIHAGDLTSTGTAKELDAAFAWLHAAPHPHKIVIAGNHDHGLSKPERRAQLLEQYPSITYLEDKLTTIEIRGRLLSIYGSPHTPHHEPGAFNYVRGQSGQWALPAFVDILVTHGPPLDHLDGRRNGCAQLRNAVRLLRPQLHVFGHVHSGRGVKCVTWDEAQRRYESIISVNRRKRFVWTLGLVAAAVGAKIRGRPKFRHGAHTMLVNASAQGWFRDNVWRGATVVDIPLQHPHRSL